MAKKKGSGAVKAGVETGREVIDQTTRVAGEVMTQASEVAGAAVGARSNVAAPIMNSVVPGGGGRSALCSRRGSSGSRWT